MSPAKLVPALVALGAGAACAQAPAAPDVSWGVSAGALHRRLVERADDGSRLLTESGPMLRVGLDAEVRLANGGAVQAAFSVAGGRLDYEGRTQAGAPIATRTGHRDLAIELSWRPLAAASWGQGWLTLQGLQQRRQIASTATATGLHETSTLWMPGVRWSYDGAAAGWRWQPSVALRASVHHDLDIHYGGVYDPSDLDGGRRRELALGLTASPAGSPWEFSVQWTHTRQVASARQPIRRGGVAAGTVRQPRVEIDDFGVQVRRTF